MSFARLFQILRQRLRSMFRRERLDDELDHELSFHLEQLEQENLESGMSPDEARRQARLALGNMAVFKEECRDERRVSWFYDFVQDIRYGWRIMRKHAGFTAIAAISLALGIGGNTAILNVGAALLFGDLPLPDGDRLFVVQTLQVKDPNQTRPASVPNYIAWRDRNQVFESIGASIANQQDLAGDDINAAPERLSGQQVTPSLFDTLGVQPQLGRLFREDEARAGDPRRVVLLSHRVWQRRFAGDHGILGKQIRMNGQSVTVVGVMPRGFFYPIENTDFWTPLVFNQFQLQGSARFFQVIGRLKAGVTPDQAQADVATIAAQVAKDIPGYEGWTAKIVPLREHWFGWIRGPLLTLESAVILVLLIACANVSTLLLARVPARQPEITMRLLMGAGRNRIVRQFLTESLLLSLIAGTLGMGIAWWGLSGLESLQPPIGRISTAGLGQNNGIFAWAALLSVVSSVFFGILPALVAISSGSDVRQATAHRKRGSLSSVLVSAQVGLALILLISSGLLINSFIRLVFDDRGFDPRGLLTFEYRLPIGDYLKGMGTYKGLPSLQVAPPTDAIKRVYEKLKTTPGVETVAGASAQPVGAPVQPTAILRIEGQPIPESVKERSDAIVTYFLVTDNFFQVMKTPVLAGRSFDARDTRSAPWVAIINESLARKFWPNEDPLGKHFTVDAVSGEQPREVIGIVRDVPLQYVRNQTQAPQPVAYTPYLQQAERYEGIGGNMFGQMIFFVRGKQDRASLASAVRSAVAEVDPNRPLANMQMMMEFVGDRMELLRRYVSVLAMFALMATILAAVGVYGVMSSSVSQRTREIGIRIAMGATTRDIVALVAAPAFWAIAGGLVLGVVGSLVATTWITPQLWGVSARDPLTYLAITAFLIIVAAVACFIPARRALRVQPTEALRTD